MIICRTVWAISGLQSPAVRMEVIRAVAYLQDDPMVIKGDYISTSPKECEFTVRFEASATE